MRPVEGRQSGAEPGVLQVTGPGERVVPANSATMPESESGGRPAAFLDRDGTVIVEKHYLADPGGVELIPGTASALRALKGAGYALVLVTNQSGIARGLISLEAFHAVQRRLAEILALEGVELDGVYFCPHHPEFTGPCLCRKPGLELYRRAGQDLGLDLGRSVYIGDRLGDVIPAQALGGTGYLVRTGYGAGEAANVPEGVSVVDDLTVAVEAVLRSSNRS